MQNDSRTKPVIAMYTAEYSVNGFKSLHLKESVLADGTLYLPGLNAGVSRGGTDERYPAQADCQCTTAMR